MNYKLIQEINPALSPIEQVLYNRGIPLEAIPHYCETSQEDILDTNLISNIREGAEMLVRHIAANDKTYIQVDPDYDGFSSSATLINYLHDLFPSFVENYVVWGLHTTKEHGIDLEFLPPDVKFIIAPDSSSNEIDLHQELYNKGIDILVIDHHEAEQVSPYACVINNQLDNYPNKTLSGVGMVYKFCCYFDNLLGTSNANKYLDLVATGLIGDMMDVRNCETKELIRQGLSNIRNPFIKGIIEKDSFHFKDEITQHKIAFYLVPLVNAVTRVGNLNDKKILFESMLEYKAYQLIPSTKRGEKDQTEQIVTQALRMCTNVKKAQTTERDNNFSTIKKIIEENQLTKHKILMVCLGPEHMVNKNLTGLIANEIANEYQQPTLILNQKVDEKNIIHYVGSGRNFTNSPIENLKDLLCSTNCIEWAEGHQSAFGFSILDKDIDNFLHNTDILLQNIIFIPSYYVDYIFSANKDYYQTVLDLGLQEDLWGQNVQEPLLAFENIKITKDNLFLLAKDRNPTLKINLPNNISAIKFKSNEEEFNNLFSENGFVEVNIVGTCAINNWMGNVNPQILIKDYEIVKRQAYYF